MCRFATCRTRATTGKLLKWSSESSCTAVTEIERVKLEEKCESNDGGSKGTYFLKMEELCPSENIVTTRTQCVITHRNTVRLSNETDRDNLLAVFLEVQMVFVIVLCLHYESVL
jgi:hypothetical protein